jgi:predicted nucleic acid-binding protein
MMLYWDSSAVVASILNEKSGIEIDEFVESLSEKSRIYTAITTPLEIESALQRRLREQSITAKEADTGRITATEFRKIAFLIVSDHNVMDMALHLQMIYSLRPADAIQLASARVGTENPSKVHFLCLDDKLNAAAKLEGFDVPF